MSHQSDSQRLQDCPTTKLQDDLFRTKSWIEGHSCLRLKNESQFSIASSFWADGTTKTLRQGR
jgi:hypothetical protein